MTRIRRRRAAVVPCLLAPCLLTVLIALMTEVAQAQSITLIASADTAGHIGPCEGCPQHAGYGGLARRATLLKQLRSAGPVLLVDAGNALFGGESLASSGDVIAAAYGELQYDAMNLSWRDFRLGKAPTRALLERAKFDVVSANVVDAANGQPLAKPYTVKTIAGRRVTLIGATQAPAGADFLPHLKEQLAGIKIDPPVDALARWLPKAKAEADVLVLLYYGSPRDLRPIVERFGNDLSAVVIGGSRPDQLPSGASPPIIGTSEHGKHLAKVELEPAQRRATVEQIAVAPELQAEPRLDAVLAQFTAQPRVQASAHPPTKSPPPPVKAAAAVPASKGPAAAKQDAAAEKLAAERYLQFTEAARQQVLTPASCPFAPSSTVLVLGTDPTALATFVQTRIAYEPYAGVVRGAEGTLASHAAGDWDRAVLLQALLAEAGHKSRLKVIARTPAEASAVVDSYLKQPATIASWFAGANGGEPVQSAEPTELVKQAGAVPENRRLYDQQEAARVQRMVAEALDAAAHETPRLLATLQSAAKVGQPFDAWRAKLLAGAAERVEVEIDAPNGATVLTVAPEASPADAARLASATTIDAPPADKIAKLSVRLELTAGEDGKPTGAAVKLIDRKMPLGNLFRRPIRLEIIPSDDAAAAKPTATWTKADWSKFVVGFRNFQAILRVGDEWEGSKVFDTDGRIHSVSSDGRIEGASQIGGSVGRGFGGGLLGGGGDEAPAKPKSRIESLVMTFELSMPGEKPQSQQRLIYGKDRTGVTPVFTADALVTAGPVSAHATSWMLLDAVTRNAPLAMRVINGDDPKRFEQTDDAVRFPVMLYDWHTIRLIAAQRQMSADAGLTFLGGPSIVLHGTHVTMPSDKEIATRHTVDVALDGAALLPRAADRVEQAARANATMGIAATVLESGLLRVIDPANGPRGAYVAFEEARAAGAQAVAIAAGADASGVKPPAIVAWSLARNESGRTLVFAGGETNTAWWSVDPATGATIGRGDGGEGQSAIEYLQITKKNLDNLKCMVEFSNKIIRGESKKGTAQQWMMCMTASDNPGSGHGVPGAVENLYQQDMGLGKICDILGGAKDLYDAANMD